MKFTIKLNHNIHRLVIANLFFKYGIGGSRIKKGCKNTAHCWRRVCQEVRE